MTKHTLTPDSITAAKALVSRLCENGHVRMSVPVDFARDEDMLICALIEAAEKTLATPPVASGAAPAEFEPWLRNICITAPPPQAYDLAKQAWAQGMKRGAALASREASSATLTDEQERAAFERELPEAGYYVPERGKEPGSQYIHQRDEDRFFGWKMARATLASREASPQSSPAPLTKVLSALANEWEREGAAKGVRDEPNARGQALAYRICAGDLRGRLDALASPQVAPEGRNVTAKEHATLMGAARASSVLVSSGRAAPVQVAPQDDARDAARYRAWRDASLTTSSHFLDAIVEYMESRTDAGKLPTADEVDAAMDAAMTSAAAAKPTEPTLPTQGEQA